MTVSHPAPSSHRARAGGFTLIEVMIVVAIIAILATIALPSYRNYILRGEIAQATSALSSYQALMERHFQDNRTYATVGTGATARPTPCATAQTYGTFVVSCFGTPTASGYIVRAVGSGSTTGFTFTINQAGTQTTIAPSGWGDCDRQWITKKGAPCN